MRSLEERSARFGALAVRATPSELAPSVEEHPQCGAIGGDPHARCGRVGVGARLGELAIERRVGAERRRPAEQVHPPVPNGAGAADGVRDGEPGLDGFAGLLPRADGGQREAEVDW